MRHSLLEAEKQFRRVNAFREMQILRRALERQTPGQYSHLQRRLTSAQDRPKF
jgi:hypothetical protein